MENQQQNVKARRGFATMDPERQREIASQGGKAAHELGVAHEWSREEAKAAGRKGGLNRTRSQFNRTENDGSSHFL